MNDEHDAEQNEANEIEQLLHGFGAEVDTEMDETGQRGLRGGSARGR